jgi:ubiquinone/menaquinone biosynthesis C-methylase UbiE
VRGADPETKERVRRFWESESCGERYGDDQDRVRYALEPEILPFADFPSARGKCVLEIGVGMGSDFVRWLRAGAIATGIDLTERAVAITRERVAVEGFQADVNVADAEALPFDDEQFDLVYSWGVLHHTPDTAKAIDEAYRVLVPGGRLKVMVYHRRSWVALAAWARFALLRGRPFQSLRAAVNQVESPGTQAFTRGEARDLVSRFADVVIRAKLTHWDRKLAPAVAGVCGDTFGWFLLMEACKPHGVASGPSVWEPRRS